MRSYDDAAQRCYLAGAPTSIFGARAAGARNKAGITPTSTTRPPIIKASPNAETAAVMTACLAIKLWLATAASTGPYPSPCRCAVNRPVAAIMAGDELSKFSPITDRQNTVLWLKTAANKAMPTEPETC